MDIDIYVKELEGSREVRIPWLPDEVKYERNGAKMAQYEIMDVGDVHMPAGTSLAKIFWESSLPGEGHKDLPFIRGSWQNPKNIDTILNDWYEKGTPLNILMTGTPINCDVYLVNYDNSFESGYGDIKYQIEFEKKRDITIKSTKVKTSSSSSTKKSSTKSRTHTVKKGDNLWSLAEKYYGSGSKYKTIYNANKTIIEKTAKKYGKKSSDGGWWIYPGTKLTIP